MESLRSAYEKAGFAPLPSLEYALIHKVIAWLLTALLISTIPIVFNQHLKRFYNIIQVIWRPLIY